MTDTYRPLIGDTSSKVLLEEKSKSMTDEDPLLRQLPKELLEFVVSPAQNSTALEYVERNICEAIFHLILAIILFPYSVCRMILVRQGQQALTMNNGVPEILGPGRHVLLSPFNSYVGICNETDPVVNHGPLHILRVGIGQLGYGVDMEHGKPMLLSRGKHVIRSNTFLWRGFLTFRDARTTLDNIEVLRVETGYVASCYRHGQLFILTPGLHLIQPPDRFGLLLSTQITILDLPFAVHETSDYVPLGIKSAVFYRVVEPLKALVRIQNVHKQIEETSVATLAGIIRSSSLSDVASRSQPFYHRAQQQLQQQENDENDSNKNRYQPSAPFFQHVHDEFIQQLHDHVLDEWGIEVQNIRIESLKINDDRLQQDISSQAIEVSKQHNRYIMLQKQQEIATVEAETRARQLQIDTQADTSRIRTRAQAEADAIIIKAKADKEATELKGQGEAEYARLLESTKLGTELASMKIQSEALKGLQQIAYVPHLPGLLQSKGVFADSHLLMPTFK